MIYTRMRTECPNIAIRTMSYTLYEICTVCTFSTIYSVKRSMRYVQWIKWIQWCPNGSLTTATLSGNQPLSTPLQYWGVLSNLVSEIFSQSARLQSHTRMVTCEAAGIQRMAQCLLGYSLVQPPTCPTRTRGRRTWEPN